ncbi:MAG: hypothetical protein ACI31E_00620 [Muribaculaceae bacterium]
MIASPHDQNRYYIPSDSDPTMSFAAIITGLLVWFSLPAFLASRLSADKLPTVRTASKWAGILIIVGGILYGL